MPWPEINRGNADLLQLVAAAADLCRRPLRHAVIALRDPEDGECCLRLEVRSPAGERLPAEDLDLEIFPSGSGANRSLHLTLAWLADDSLPMLWQGSHPIWMDGGGERCAMPEGGQPIEALARRLRALLAGEVGG